MVKNLNDINSIVNIWVREIRDTNLQQDRARFRRNLEKIGEVCAYEISKHLPYREAVTLTPLGESVCRDLEQQPVLATIFRAGIPLHQGLLNYFDRADNAFVAAYRKHHRDGSFEIAQQYHTAPPLAGRPLIIADPLLATGSSMSLALQVLTDAEKPSCIHVVSAIACTVGIELIKRRFPEAWIWTAAVDDELTARGYIVPGLGDAGDLAYGDKLQS